MDAATTQTDAAPQPGPLQGLCVLVVEDEALIALGVEQALRDLGCGDVTVAFHVDDALRIAQETAFDVAILDVNVAGRPVFPVADLLLQRAIPFVFATGYGPETIRVDLRHHPVVGKPYQPRDLSEAIQRLRTSPQQ